VGNITYQEKDYLIRNKHRSCRDIAQELGVNHKTISRWLRIYGIPYRKTSWSVGRYTRTKGWKHTEDAKRRMSIGSRKTAPKGEKHWYWKGGVSPLRNKLEGTFAYKEWRKKVFERDNYTCRDCGQRGGYLEAHHKKPFLTIIKEIDMAIENKYEYALSCKVLWEISNGITYCLQCHAKHDKQRKIPLKNKRGVLSEI